MVSVTGHPMFGVRDRGFDTERHVFRARIMVSSLMSKDIFSTLAKYEKDENYWTAALVYVLEYLWNDPNRSNEQRVACARFLERLCRLSFGPDETLCFQAQVTFKDTERGERSVLDARIASDSKYVGIEVKDTSGLNQEPKDYKERLLEAAGERDCRLVLLRRSRLTPDELTKVRLYVDCDCRWFEVYRWMQDMKSEMSTTGTSVGRYLLEQFSQFLNEKGVPLMTRVTRDGLTRSLEEVPSLLNMVRQWAEREFERRGVTATLTKHFVDTGWIGFYMGSRRDARDEECYAFYVEADDPVNIIMETTEQAMEKLEKKIIDQPRLRELNERVLDTYVHDNIMRVYAHRPLTTVFQKDSEAQQSDEVYLLLDGMLQELDSIKIEVGGKPRR